MTEDKNEKRPTATEALSFLADLRAAMRAIYGKESLTADVDVSLTLDFNPAATPPVVLQALRCSFHPREVKRT